MGVIKLKDSTCSLSRLWLPALNVIKLFVMN